MIMETEHCSRKNKESLMRSKGAFMCGNNVGLGNRISLTREIKMLTQEFGEQDEETPDNPVIAADKEENKPE